MASSNPHTLKGKQFLVTAGPTYEPIDPVRFIGNRSSGKMGYQIAEQLGKAGASVILVSGPTNLQAQHPSIHLINVETAAAMYEESIKHFPDCDGAILAAAVADFTPKNPGEQKLKKGNAETMTLELVRTKDILYHLGQKKTQQQVLAGFSLETENAQANAQKKLTSKNLDFIVVNLATQAEGGFGKDRNQISILYRDGTTIDYPLQTKAKVAATIVDQLESRLQPG